MSSSDLPPKPKTYAEALQTARTPARLHFSPGPEYADDKRMFQGIAGIERAPNGRLWATWYCGGQGESWCNYVLLATSDDDGETWSEPLLVVDHPERVRVADSCIWLDPTGRLWLFWKQGHTLHDGQWGVWAITTDQPDQPRPTWSEPRRIADGVMLNKPLVRSNGEWLLPISHNNANMLKSELRMLPPHLRTHLGDMVTDEERQQINEREGAWVYVSKDDGRTFEPRGRACVPEDYRQHNEHMLIERADGSLWMLMRTAYGIGQSESHDGGATWSSVTESGIPHTNSRFCLRRLQSGNLLLVKHGPMQQRADDNGEPVKIGRKDMRAFLSEDEGKTWFGGLPIKERGTYPDATQAPDGTIYLVHDLGRREEKMILLTRFTEQDVRAGAYVSDRAKPSMLVNQATGVIPEDNDWKQLKQNEEPGEDLIFTGI